MRQNFIMFAAAAALFSFVGSAHATQPNIIHIMVDD
jgi:hypothetical protein